MIEKNLNKLNVSANAESVVTLIGNVADLTITDMAAIYDVKIEGDVGTLKIAQFHSGENNLTITGKVLEGITHSTRMPSMGFFECENMEIIQDGKWNSNLFIRANLYDKSVAYKPYQIEELESALDGLGLGEETTINTPTGSTLTAFKTAAVSVSETKDEVFENMKQSEEMTKLLEQIEEKNNDEQKVLEATPIVALDINISTYFSPKGASSKYEEQEVTELIGDNKFAFTIKVPADQYDADVIYTVVRNHENADGTTSMDVLETIQEGDVLTFASDKFSTFLIVEVKASDKPSEPSEPSEPTEPTEPSEPTEPIEPTEPSEPMEPIEPTEPSESTEPSEPTESSEPEAPGTPEVLGESQDSGDAAKEETIMDNAQATATTPTETGDVNTYVLPCIMLLGSIITAIILARKEDLFIIR